MIIMLDNLYLTTAKVCSQAHNVCKHPTVYYDIRIIVNHMHTYLFDH